MRLGWGTAGAGCCQGLKRRRAEGGRLRWEVVWDAGTPPAGSRHPAQGAEPVRIWALSTFSKILRFLGKLAPILLRRFWQGKACISHNASFRRPPARSNTSRKLQPRLASRALSQHHPQCRCWLQAGSQTMAAASLCGSTGCKPQGR